MWNPKHNFNRRKQIIILCIKEITKLDLIQMICCASKFTYAIETVRQVWRYIVLHLLKIHIYLLK